MSGDFVNTEDGTGIVHMAPTFGADDKRVADENGVPAMVVMNEDGELVPIVDERGRYIKSMKNLGSFVKKELDPNEENKPLDVEIAVMMKKKEGF